MQRIHAQVVARVDCDISSANASILQLTLHSSRRIPETSYYLGLQSTKTHGSQDLNRLYIYDVFRGERAVIVRLPHRRRRVLRRRSRSIH